MDRQQVDALIAEIMTEHFDHLRAELEARIDRAVGSKPLPPFGPPPVWVAGRHGAGVNVRHRNGVFHARRDTEEEPGKSDAWLPLLVGVATMEFQWTDDRRITLSVELSDGTTKAVSHDLAVPIVRGFWEVEADYKPGDRVFRFGEWHATAESKGIDPTGAEAEGKWIKVNGKAARGVSFKVDDDGTISENGHPIGTLKPMVVELFNKLTNRTE